MNKDDSLASQDVADKDSGDEIKITINGSTVKTKCPGIPP